MLAKKQQASSVFSPLPVSFFFIYIIIIKSFSKLQKQIQAITVTQLQSYKQSILQIKFAIGNIIVLHCENEKLPFSYWLRAKCHLQRLTSSPKSCQKRGELPSSLGFKTTSPNVLFYRQRDLGWVQQQRKMETDPKAIARARTLQGMEFLSDPTCGIF